MSNKKSLIEALQRHNRLVEYNFYIPKDESYEKAENIETDEVIDEQDVPAEEEQTPAPPPTGEINQDTASAEDTTTTTTTPEPTTTDTQVSSTPQGEVEVSVTDLVNNTKDTKNSVDKNTEVIQQLMAKITELEDMMTSMVEMGNQIEKLEDEIEKRNPTPEEKLDMRSLSSFPYNLKLTDYWDTQVGPYDTINRSETVTQTDNPEDKEYVLTQKDVESDYNEGDIANSFY